MNVLIVLVTFFLMEGITWLTHKYVMHGFLWTLHRDHHDKSHTGTMERNDYFFLIFAIPAISMMFYGSLHDFNYWFYIGLGITLYGLAYFWYTISLYISAYGYFAIPKALTCWVSDVHISNITSIPGKKRVNVLFSLGAR